MYTIYQEQDEISNCFHQVDNNNPSPLTVSNLRDDFDSPAPCPKIKEVRIIITPAHINQHCEPLPSHPITLFAAELERAIHFLSFLLYHFQSFTAPSLL